MSGACYGCNFEEDACLQCIHNGYDPKGDLLRSEMRGYMMTKKRVLSIITNLQINAASSEKHIYGNVWDTIMKLEFEPYEEK